MAGGAGAAAVSAEQNALIGTPLAMHPVRLTHAAAEVVLTPATAQDLEPLVALRIEAMRESLERIGRFDPVRSRERFVSGFEPRHTWHIEVEGERVGFVVVKPMEHFLLLDHLYVRPAFQGQGLGAVVLQRVFQQADAAGLPVRLGALRGSESNRFYQRHGFRLVEESEWDLYYVREAVATAKAKPC
jgi:GNAT superfamily N-acetyltransferase